MYHYHIFEFSKVGRNVHSTTGQYVILNTDGCIYIGSIMHELIHSLGNFVFLIYSRNLKFEIDYAMLLHRVNVSRIRL